MLPERAGVPLGALAAVTGGRVVGDPAVRITDVTHDSRQVHPGSLFVAVRGLRTDGHRFVAAAIEMGAVAVCVEGEAPKEAHGVKRVPQLVVDAARSVLPALAAEVHGHPSRKMAVVGVTGTNGKTTVTHMMEAMAEAAGRPAALVGTVGARVAGQAVSVARTTPEASDLQRLLAHMVAAGVQVAAVEVSSHALALQRAGATWFEVSAFTNLSRDHLDFHGDLESYYRTKASLFRPERTGHAVLWVDDPAGSRLAASVDLPVTTVGFSRQALVRAEEVRSAVGENLFTLVVPEGRRRVRLPLGGDFNVANALVSVACALRVGLPLEAACSGLEAMRQVPGRFEAVDAGQDFSVVVDYAHTPEGVQSVVSAAGKLTSGRLIVVLGAGGERDREKRPLMGQAAAPAELVVVTSDNPRSEDPVAIVEAVAGGARAAGARVLEEPDRRSAIGQALRMAGVGDVVLILGKGHEQGQEVAGRVLPFDDRQVVRQELAAL